MGENKIDKDQEVEKPNTDQQQRYGSHQLGRHNLEEPSSLIIANENNGEGTSTIQQHLIN